MNEFQERLINLGFNPNRIGFKYWVYTFKLIETKKNDLKDIYLKDIYEKIQKENNEKITTISKAMDRSYQEAKPILKSKLNIDKKVSMRGFINIIKGL